MMKKTISLKKNFIMNVLLTMSSFIFPLISFPYVSRVLLPIGTGKVSFATSLISYFVIFSQLGIPTYGIRACAKVRDDKNELTRVSHELLIINLIFAIVSYIALTFVLLFVSRLFDDRCLYIVVSMTILLNAIGMEWLYKALEQYSYITKRSILFKFVALISMFLLIHKQSDYIIYAGISILAASASNICNFFNVHKYIDLKPVGNYNLERHIKPIAVFFAMSCATTIYTNLDTVMLGFMTSDMEVGYYNAAVKIKTILVSIVTSLGTVLLPRASYYVEHNMLSEFNRITSKALKFVLLLASPMIVYFILFAKEGIYFLSGNAYASSIIPMKIILITLLFIGISNITGIQILIPQGKERVVLYSEIAGAIVNVIINALLIPQMASAGAAIGTVVAELVVLLVQYYAVRKEISKVVCELPIFKIFFAIVLGCLASFWVKIFNFSYFLTLFSSAILFFSVYGLFLLIMGEESIVEIVDQVLCKVIKKKK